MKAGSIVIGMLRLYKLFISPLLPSACRFYPSCSEYAMQAVETQGGFDQKYRHCAKCNFYQAVREEEGASAAITAELLKRLS